jgi:hypothetical protein
VVGNGWTLIAAAGDPLEPLDPEHRVVLDELDAKIASLDPQAASGVTDLDGRLTDWLADHGVHAVLVRPDFYVFGSAQSEAALPALVEDLRTQLGVSTRPLTKEH